MTLEAPVGADGEPTAPIANPVPHTAMCSNCGGRLHHKPNDDDAGRTWMHVDTATVACWLPSLRDPA